MITEKELKETIISILSQEWSNKPSLQKKTQTELESLIEKSILIPRSENEFEIHPYPINHGTGKEVGDFVGRVGEYVILRVHGLLENGSYLVTGPKSKTYQTNKYEVLAARIKWTHGTPLLKFENRTTLLHFDDSEE